MSPCLIKEEIYAPVTAPVTVPVCDKNKVGKWIGLNWFVNCCESNYAEAGLFITSGYKYSSPMLVSNELAKRIKY
jgi:hypothetical protein